MSINTLTDHGLIRELARRDSADGSVRLTWNSETEEITLEVRLLSCDFTVDNVPPADALEAFNHPFAYGDWALKTGKAKYSAVA